MRIVLLSLLTLLILQLPSLVSNKAHAEETSAVFFVNLKDGVEVKSPVAVIMGVRGMRVAPAGTMDEGTGHHHIVVDGAPVAKGAIVPADSSHIHFGKGQSEAEIPLTPGEHTLTLQFADGLHRSYGEEMAATITIKVVP